MTNTIDPKLIRYVAKLRAECLYNGPCAEKDECDCDAEELHTRNMVSRSAIASRQAVVPLEWRSKENYSTAETPFGEYTVTRYEESDGIGWEAVYQDAEVIGTFPTEADARNACDALHTQRINSALAAPVRDETERRDKKELLAEALQAVKAFNDWTHVNEAEWTGWGDGDVPPAAEWWRVKSGQALKALQEIRFSQTSKPEGDEASINIDRLKRGDFTPDSFDEHDNDDPGDTP